MIKRITHLLAGLFRFLRDELIYPVSRLLRVWLTRFYFRHKPKLSRTYWQQYWADTRQSSSGSTAKAVSRILFKSIFRLGLGLLLLLVVFYLAVYMGVFGSVPSEDELRSRQNNTASEVYSADGVLLGRYYIQDRTNVRFDDISPSVIDALIATEDVRFYEHKGVDTKSLLRVFFKTLLLQEESAGGGSTLSQQLAKNLYPRREYRLLSTPVNKLREFIIARRLESIYSKQEILELYLNTVPMGGNLYGIERSARRFFNTSADSIKTEEAAVLVGMLKATTTYNPRLDLERSRQRRDVVLSQMAKYDFLSPAAADSLKSLPLKLRYRYETHNDGLAPYFREQLRLELAKWAATQKKENGEPYNLYTDGLKIYTTLDANMQAHAEKAVRRRMALLQNQFDAHWKGRTPWGNDASVIQNALLRSDRYKKAKAAGLSDEEIRQMFREAVPMTVFSWRGNSKKDMSPMDSLRYYQRFLNTGLVSIEPGTGYVKAWVGGINHAFFKYDHVRSRRQVGSTFKPFVYAAALERGLDPCTYFPNQLITYPEYENWSPRNANNQYGGEYSMRGALANSVNTISAQVLMQTGIDRTVSLAHRLGLQSSLPKVPALALGVADLSLYEMVSAYASFANNGRHVKPVYITRITDRNGRVLHQHHLGSDVRRAMSTKNAAIMLQLMQGVVEEGSAQRLRSEFGLQMDIAGKTGTTQDHADGWFIGITPGLVTGVWVGAESPLVRFRTLDMGQGSRTALPIWGDYMALLSRDRQHAELRNSRFRPLPPELLASLSCASFLEEQPVEENFLDRLLDRLTSKRGRSYDEWKEQARERRKEEKARKKERKRRERERERD